MVVGSGYIAVELAGILQALGSDVTLVIRYNKVLRSFDPMLSDALMKEMEKAGVKFAKFSKVRHFSMISLVKSKAKAFPLIDHWLYS